MEQLIADLGFPIACVLAMGIFINNKEKQEQADVKERTAQYHKIIEELRNDSNETRDKYMESMTAFADALNKLSTAVDNTNFRLTRVEEDIEGIKKAVDLAFTNLEK